MAVERLTAAARWEIGLLFATLSKEGTLGDKIRTATPVNIIATPASA